MKLGGLRRSSMIKYAGRSFSYKKSTSGRNTLKTYLKNYRSTDGQNNKIKEDEPSGVREALAKYSRKKAASYTLTGNKFEAGAKSLTESIDSFEKLLKEEKPDMDKAFDAAKEFTEGYNAIYSAASSSSDKSVASKARYISTASSMFSRALDKVGISVDRKGVMSIDKDAFMKAEKKDLSGIFGKKSSFASTIEEQADSISVLNAVSNATYSSGMENSYTSAMSGSIFSKYF